MISEREKAIGVRLRAFREGLQIPRSRFAGTIGFGTERIASYESGRAPLRYDVFRAISKHYHISPRWLAEEIGGPRTSEIDDPDFPDQIRPRALFSEVYDRFLTKKLAQEQTEIEKEFRHLSDQLDDFFKKISDYETRQKINPSTISRVMSALDKLIITKEQYEQTIAAPIQKRLKRLKGSQKVRR